MNALPDRRLLINLVRRDVVNFPDVHERPEARLHVVDIVLACLGHPGGLRALVAALQTMSPESAGTKRVAMLIESATLANLLADSEVKRVHDLLRRGVEVHEPGWWREVLETAGITVPKRVPSVVHAFDQLASQRTGADGVPPALHLVTVLANRLDGPIAVELLNWSEGQATRLEVPDDGRVFEPPSPQGVAGPADTAVPTRDPSPHPDAPSVPRVPDDLAEPYATIGSEMPDLNVTDYPVAVNSPDLADPDFFLGDAMPLAQDRRAGLLPQVWGDVPQRNPNFTGREVLLENLHAALAVERQTAVLPQALHGMGGVGKSHVAIEYVHRHSSEYNLIWWIPSEQPAQILASLTKLAQRLGLDVSPEANAAVPAVQEALSTGSVPYERWLLVFDNAESPQEVQQYFPTGGAGKILVTSRDPNWARVTQAIEVDVFTREESTTFLCNRNPDLTIGEANKLADALGDLPLAVEQAAAWRAVTGMRVDEYLALLEDKRIELLDAAPSPDYGLSVAAAWNVSIDRLSEVNEAALQLLQICSFFAPEPISRDLFAGSPVAPITAALDYALSDKFRLSRAIRDIQKFALARIDHRNNTLQIHRLIQAVINAGMDDQQQDVMRRGAHTLLANSDPNDPTKRDQWARYQALVPHVRWSRAVKSDDPRVQDLVSGIVQFLYHWGDHTGAQALAEESYVERVRDRGESDPHTLRLAKWVGWMRFVNGQYQQARELNRRTLDLYRAEHGDEDEGTIDAMYVVAIDLEAAGDFVAARELKDRALAAARRAFGDSDPTTLICAHALGVSLRLLGEFQLAADLDKDTYQRRAVALGPDQVETLHTLNELIIDRREVGRYVEARKQQEELFARHLALYGPDTPGTLRAARSLAVARRKAGDHSGAKQLAEETLERYQRRYDDDFPETIATALNYAIDLRHDGQLDAAYELGVATLERFQRKYGVRHPHTLSAATNLAIVERQLGKLEHALDRNREALDALRSQLGDDHPVTLICATNYASDLWAVGDFQAAYERDTDTLARSERRLGVEHPSTLACSVNLSLDLRSLGRVAEADRMLTDTMQRFRRVLGDRHPATLNARENLRADCDVDPMPI